MRHILLLTDPSERPLLISVLKRADPDVKITSISTLEELDAATRSPAPDLRLVTFCTGVIVPGEVIKRLPGPGYNFHPGPPEIRGLFPAVFALYHGAAKFGATIHELAPKVDTGDIVGVIRADIPDGTDRFHLECLARRLVTELFVHFSAHLVKLDVPLPHVAEKWEGRIWTRKDFDALCRLPDDISEEEFALRLRACGEGPEHALHFERFGRTFGLSSLPGQGAVFRGGVPIEAKGKATGGT